MFFSAVIVSNLCLVFHIYQVAAKCNCSCISAPVIPVKPKSNHKAATATPIVIPSTVATEVTNNGDMCNPLSPWFSWNDPLSWPLDNSTVSEPIGLTDSQLSTQQPTTIDYITRKHNCLRTKPAAGNMLSMEWDAEAASQAQTWANNCVFAHNDASQRTTSKFACGQNIAMSTGMPLSWNEIINMWYNEVNDYGSNSGKDTGHYTQIVWAKSFQVGCGYRNCGSMFFYVCNYCPAGNIIGSSPYIHGQSCASCPSSCTNSKLCTNACPLTNFYSNCDSLQAANNICANPASDIAQKCSASCNCQGKVY